MQYLEFKNCFEKYKVFSINEIEKINPNFNKMNLLSWQKKEYIIKLRNNFYKFTENKSDEDLLFLIANKIYSPSYISLESAFSYYGIIPEGVFSVNSISTLKTNNFKNKLGNFNYKNIKTNLFFGYKLVQKKEYTFKIAEIEKAILDYLYLNSSLKTIDDILALRLNKFIILEKLNLQKLVDYTTFYNSKVLTNKIKILIQFLND